MKKQQGFATLLCSLILIFIVTLNVFIGAKASVLEQKTANNLYRAEEAFENAENGVRVMVSQLKANPSQAKADIPPVVTGSYTVSYAYNAGVNPIITSIGNGSGNASRTITQFVIYTPGNPGQISTPINDALTALGTISVSGSVDISSVKAGGQVSTSGSATIGGLQASSTNTSITQNASQFKIALLDSNNNVLKDANGNVIYRNMTVDEYFMLYFGTLCPTAVAANNPPACSAEAKVTISNSSTGYVCNESCNNADLAAQYALGKRIMWLEQSGMKINSNVVLGSPSDPVLILVMNSGSVQINGTSKIYGVVYVDVPDQLSEMTCSCSATYKVASVTNSGTDLLSAVFSNPITSSVAVNAGIQPAACTVNVCQAGLSLSQNITSYPASGNGKDAVPAGPCTPTTSSTKVNDQGTCSYAALVTTGSNKTPVQIDVLGTWDNSGGGNALIEGAAITSGNFVGQGGINLVKNSGIVTKFESSPAGVAPKSNGWSDMN